MAKSKKHGFMVKGTSKKEERKKHKGGKRKHKGGKRKHK